MAKDYTKYTVEALGENLNKRQLVFTIVKDWATKNKPSLKEIQATFPDETQGSKGFVVKKSEVKDAKRFNMQEPLSIKNGTQVVVSNQWGTKNIAAFLELAEKLEYKVTSVSNESNEEEAITPSSHLTAEQIADFKEKEAGIEGDYCENEWAAVKLYNSLISAGDTAWADWTLQKIEDAADESRMLERVAKILKERGETDRFLATAKKAEAMAKNTDEMMSLAELVSDSNKDWVTELYKKAEDKAASVSDYIKLADEVKEIDQNWVIRLYQKAENVVAYYAHLTALADKVKEFDKDWAIKLYQKAAQKADDSHDLRALCELVFPFDKDWAMKLLEKAEEKAEDFNDFINIGDVYGKPDGLADKDKARTFFEKAISLIDNEWNKENLLESAQECLGNEDVFTKKIVQLIEDAIPKLKLPKQYFPDYKLEWGKYITFTLEHVEEDCDFAIKLNMETNEVIGHPDRDNVLSRWFDAEDAQMYIAYVDARSYDGYLRIWGENEGEADEWGINGYDYGFEELEDGELPEGVTGDDIWNTIGDGKTIYALFDYVKTHGA
jgi:hypothetical protein